MAKKKLLFHHDKAPAHTSRVAVPNLFDLRFEVLPRALYTLDLAPSDYFLFSNLKKRVAG